MKKFLLALIVVTLLSLHASAAPFYWDADLDATNNNAFDGSGLGGSGDWDNLATSNWWDGVSVVDTTWDDTANSGAIFWGGAGAVNLPSVALPQVFLSCRPITR